MYPARGLSSSRITSGLARPGVSIAIRPRMQIHFFDRKIIRTRWPRINRDPLQKAGNLIMRIARGSIRRRKKKYGKPSSPGSPPYSRQPGRTPPFKMIFSVPFRLGTSVIVGMVGFTPNRGVMVPGLHEHGGTALRKVYSWGGQRRMKSGRYGKKINVYKPMMVRYPKRPFMEPALMKARRLLPYLWLNSVSRAA